MLKILRNLSVYKWTVAAVFVLIFLQSMADLFLPTLMADIIDNGVVVGDIPYILKVGSIMLIVTAFGAFAAVGASYFSSKVAMGLGRDLRRKVFHHVEAFSLQEFNKFGTASLITRTTNDITQIQHLVMMGLRMTLSAPLMLAGGIILAVAKDPKLTMVILFAMPVLIVFLVIIFMKGMPLFHKVQKKVDRLNLVLRENLTGVRVIRSFNREKEEQARLETANRELTDISIKVNKLLAFGMPLMMLIMNLTVVGVIWFGGFRIDGGHMQIGDLMAFIQYVMLIMFALLMASMMFVMIPRAAVSAKRIHEVLSMELSVMDEGTEKADKKRGTVEFENVTFRYPGAEEPVLSGISFSVGPGETTAIIGGTGTGKSTLVNLILRFYDVTEGTIRFNGVDIRTAPTEEIRRKIGYVPQKAVIFSGTVAENIRFGNENATDEEVQHAAKIAQAHDFISKMKDGYDTLIEQGGMNLSGGQKQRLSIARALVRKPDVYIFDDSFSALDFKTDAKLRAALKEETQDKAVIIVAQRVSTVVDADQIIVLEQGRIVGKGTHQELLETNEVYREIVKSQMAEEVSAS